MMRGPTRPLEGITLNGEPLESVLIHRDTMEAFTESAHYKSKPHVITRDGFYKPRGKSKGRIIKMNNKRRVNTLTAIIEYVHERLHNNLGPFTVMDASERTGIGRSTVQGYLKFLADECDLLSHKERNGNSHPTMYHPKEFQIGDVISAWQNSDTFTHSYKRRTLKKDKVAISVEGAGTPSYEIPAILLHANCTITKNPWHAECEPIKDMFRQLACCIDKDEIIKISFSIARYILNDEGCVDLEDSEDYLEQKKAYAGHASK